MFCRVPSSSVLPPAPSESALNGSSGESSSMACGDKSSGGGEVGGIGGGEKKVRGMACWPSDVAEWGEMMRTVLPVFVFVERGRSRVR